MKKWKISFKGSVSSVLIFALLFAFTSAASLHPYYVSTTEIRVNSTQKTINLSCKMFTDDLQDALSTLYKVPVELQKRNAKADSLLNIYIKERMEIMIGEEKVNFQYLGYEIEEENTWCYFESTFRSAEKSVKVKASILYESFDSQTNFIHCFFDNDKKSFKLVNPNREAAFAF